MLMLDSIQSSGLLGILVHEQHRLLVFSRFTTNLHYFCPWSKTINGKIWSDLKMIESDIQSPTFHPRGPAHPTCAKGPPRPNSFPLIAAHLSDEAKREIGRRSPAKMVIFGFVEVHLLWLGFPAYLGLPNCLSAYCGLSAVYLDHYQV